MRVYVYCEDLWGIPGLPREITGKAAKEKGLDVLLEDRNVRPGMIFKDLDLIGIPRRIVISDKTLQNQQAEVKSRGDKDPSYISIDDVDAMI